MAEARNLTIRLSAETVRKARILAAKRDTSVSRLVAEQIEQLVREDDDYDAIRREAIADLRRGYHLGVGDGPLPTREELYDR